METNNNYPEYFKRITPKLFTLEPVLGCDLRCPECAVGGNRITKKKGWMRFEQFKILADKIRPYCQYLYLHHNGEPMLNRDIFKMIEYFSPFANINISTNAQSMTEERAERLILSGVKDVIVSIDGVSQETYAHYRVGGSVQKAFQALKHLQKYNLKHGSKVKIMPQFCVFRHNEHEMEPFAKICHSLRLRPFFKTPFIRHNSMFKNASNGYRRPAYPNIGAVKQAMAKHCQVPLMSFNVLLDGTCVLCCADNNGSTDYGNLYEQEVMDIWHSPEYLKDRWDLLTGNAPPFCTENCLNWTVGGRVHE